MKALATVLMVGATSVSATPASAHISCDGEYQIVGGQAISTPYCGDGAVARAARARGYGVSGRAVRNNPMTKDKACRMVGDDPRFTTECAGDRTTD